MTLANEARAEFAAYAMDIYGVKKEGRADYDAPETIANDLITDLLHLIRAHGGEPITTLEMAKMNFEAEEAEQYPNKRPEVS